MIAGFVVILAVAAVGARQVRFDGSIEVWFLENDQSLARYRAFLERFGADEIVVVGVFASEPVTDRSVLERIARLEERLRAVEDVVGTRSLARAPIPMGREDELRIATLLEVEAATVAEALARQSVFLRHRLVSEDLHTSALWVLLSPQTNSSMERKMKCVRAIQAISAESGFEVAVAGGPVMDVALFDYSQKDFERLGPISVVLALAVMLVFYRRLSVAIVPIAIVLSSLLLTFGTMGFVGLNVTPVSASLVSLLLAIGVAESLHLVAEHRHPELGRQGSARLATVELALPFTFTALTTIAGLSSLVVTELRPIREFGSMAAISVGYVFVVTLTLGPTLLSFIEPIGPGATSGFVSTFLSTISRVSRARTTGVLIGVFAGTVISVALLPSLEVGANPVGYLRPEASERVATERIDASLGGSTSVEISIEAEQVFAPDVMRQLKRLEAELIADPGLPSVVSYVDLIEDLNGRITGSEGLPESEAASAQLALLAEQGGALDELLVSAPESTFARMTALAPLSRAKELISRMPELDARLGRLEAPGLKLHATGTAKLMGDMGAYLFEGQRNSFAFAFLQVVVLMSLLLRSIRLGLLAMIPNLLPVLLGLAAMAMLRVPLDPGTIMVASVVLGIVVDDTIHFLVRLQRAIGRGQDLESALASAIATSGRAVLATSVVLSLGFGVMVFGNFLPNVRFGVVSAVTILIAMLTELVVLPAVLLRLRHWGFE